MPRTRILCRYYFRETHFLLESAFIKTGHIIPTLKNEEDFNEHSVIKITFCFLLNIIDIAFMPNLMNVL